MMSEEKEQFPEKYRMLYLQLNLQFQTVQGALPREQEEAEGQPLGAEPTKRGSVIQVPKVSCELGEPCPLLLKRLRIQL